MFKHQECRQESSSLPDKVPNRTEANCNEAEFRRLSQEFNGLLDAIPDSLMLLDRELKILWANQAAADGIGEAAQDLTGRSCHLLRHGSTSPCEPCPVLDCIRSGSPRLEAVVRPDGRTWEIRTVPLFDEKGEVAKVIELQRDISEHRKLEMQYLHAQKMDSIGTLAGGVAHDFNNILTVIMGLGHLTLMTMTEDDPSRRNIGGILEAAERAAHLTRELLLFSRRQVSERRPVDLNEVVGKMEKFLNRVIGEEIVLKQVPHGKPLPIFADSNHLEQVLMNLAVNARHAMPNGGEFILRTQRKVLDEGFVATYGYGKPGTYALLHVSDTGVGMSRETQQRIFEPFFTTKAVGEGTGLGLAVAYGIIKQHDGFINVYSEPGQGSTFKVYLPLIAAPILAAGGPKEVEPIVGGTETVLLAEDNDQVRELMTRVLTGAGYRVIAADNGEEAVRRYGEHAGEVQLLIFDLIMPKMNGTEARDEIRRNKPEIKTLFASGYSPDLARHKAYLDGRSYLVYKPVSPRDLLKKVREVLDATG